MTKTSCGVFHFCNVCDKYHRKLGLHMGRLNCVVRSNTVAQFADWINAGCYRTQYITVCFLCGRLITELVNWCSWQWKVFFSLYFPFYSCSPCFSCSMSKMNFCFPWQNIKSECQMVFSHFFTCAEAQCFIIVLHSAAFDNHSGIKQIGHVGFELPAGRITPWNTWEWILVFIFGLDAL